MVAKETVEGSDVNHDYIYIQGSYKEDSDPDQIFPITEGQMCWLASVWVAVHAPGPAIAERRNDELARDIAKTSQAFAERHLGACLRLLRLQL